MKRIPIGEPRTNPNITVNLTLDTHRRASTMGAIKGMRIGEYCEQAVLKQVKEDEAELLRTITASKPNRARAASKSN